MNLLEHTAVDSGVQFADTTYRWPDECSVKPATTG